MPLLRVFTGDDSHSAVLGLKEGTGIPFSTHLLFNLSPLSLTLSISLAVSPHSPICSSIAGRQRSVRESAASDGRSTEREQRAGKTCKAFLTIIPEANRKQMNNGMFAVNNANELCVQLRFWA